MSIDPLNRPADPPADRLLDTVLDLANLTAFSLDLTTRRIRWAAGPEAVVGWTAEDLAGWDQLLDHVHSEDRDELSALTPASAGGKWRSEFRLQQPVGAWRWICIQGRTVTDAKGATTRVEGVMFDDTETRTAKQRSQMLLAELQHRIKNMVAIIRSMAHRTRETSTDLDDFSAHFEGRLAAFTRTHSALARTARGEADLEEIIREELRENAPPATEPWTLSGPTVCLRQRVAEMMTLAIHELVTNAVKFGALSSPEGEIAIHWRVSDDGSRLMLEWDEQSGGPIPPVGPRGFGQELIEQALPYQIGAKTQLTFEPTGLRCRIEVALDRAPTS